MSSASFNSERNFLYEYDCADQISKESRLVKGLKSAWKVMFQYLEETLPIPTHFSDSIVDASVPTIRRNDDDFTQPKN
ncbi:hypothetical protein Ocin01_18112 [Orchesella cincta]|uniref:Uncharacterized protein n=1 Tax=Orchesella cincta TaxID=48709 RepID=A0A1D2M6G0_ORCCI|nr:hypothetical protein Ocin01_18112 [Orchesella cincta]